jgi:hypothetical protein
MNLRGLGEVLFVGVVALAVFCAWLAMADGCIWTR